MHEDLATDFTTVHKSWCCLAENLPMEQSGDLYRVTQILWQRAEERAGIQNSLVCATLPLDTLSKASSVILATVGR